MAVPSDEDIYHLLKIPTFTHGFVSSSDLKTHYFCSDTILYPTNTHIMPNIPDYHKQNIMKSYLIKFIRKKEKSSTNDRF